ncbi:MAG: hypothetical protein C0622_01455 [Desulfuromonas sp.]|nr:MAG: hypothetical protein C0622_01455 [Desulfuromonas sp.]
MIRLLLLILAGFVVYGLFTSLLRQNRPNRPSRPPENRTSDGESMVEDPECGTFIPLGEAVKGTINGRQHYFCSKKCLNDYKRKHSH